MFSRRKEETGTEDVELTKLGENATQDESAPLLGSGRAGRPNKWKGVWSSLPNKQSTSNYYKNWGYYRGGSVSITAICSNNC